jgi:ABC-type transport system involved in cytochrome c biogenesis permease subunit
MKRSLIFGLIGIIVLLWTGAGLRPLHPETPYNLRSWGGLPVQHEGRLKPIDSVARATLLLLHGKQTVKTEAGRITARQWLWEVVHGIDGAASHPVFRVDQPDLVSLLGVEPRTRQQFSYAELKTFLPELDRQYRRIPGERAQRTPFERAVAKLHYGLRVYQSLEVSFVPPSMGVAMTVSEEVERFSALLETLPEAGSPGTSSDPMFGAFVRRYQNLTRSRPLEVVPQADGPWLSLWAALADDLVPPERDPIILAYGRVADAAVAGDPVAFNDALAALRAGPLAQTLEAQATVLARELRFNNFQPFYRSMFLYVLVFLLVCVAWIRSAAPVWRQAAFGVLAVALVVHTLGLIARMRIQALPPVTNLYSSAVFIGWGTAALGLLLEKMYRNGLGAAVAALVGFATLIIAHHLSLSGDTMEQMRAVLNSNFWLTTHVLTITLGYSASFVAGFLALFFLMLGVLTPMLDRTTSKRIEGMIFGAVCFTLLFSFVGTVLGGIWADQSWGRFWGWDPKENGALLIVIWNAFILHAYATKLFRRRGFMVAVVSGNIVTSWSWFGTNMLGIGLHAYGFMDQAFLWLLLFWVSQLLIMIGALIVPRRWWRSVEALETQAQKR